MKKPEKAIGNHFGGIHCVEDAYDDGYIEGANEMCGEWEKYHNWYIKEKCVREEDLSVEEIEKLILKAINSQPWWLMSTFVNSGEIRKIAQAIVDYLKHNGKKIR